MKKFLYFYYVFGSSVTLFLGLYSVIAFSEGQIFYAISALLNFFAMFNLLLAAAEMRQVIREDK